MLTLAIATLTAIAYVIAYNTYGKWLARKVFDLDPNADTPSRTFNDGTDYVPTSREVVFGHHFTSIAGTGPIVGPAIAVFWGWLPALIWVVFGSIFIGAVHDFGSLVVSLRNKGKTIGEIAGSVISTRARLLFLGILCLALAVVIGIFGLVIATIFATYPVSVFPVWAEIPLALLVGFWVYRRKTNLLLPSLLALLAMYVTIYIGAYHLPIDLTAWSVPRDGVFAEQQNLSPYFNATVIWTLVLLVYCYVASVLPVWTLLQPRDFINSHELLLALAILMMGLCIAPFTQSGLEMVAPAFNDNPPSDAPPFIPFLFITIACGAISGFHCLVASGTTSKQIKCETDARMVGYGSMLLEGGLATMVILACTAGIGRGIYQYDGEALRFTPIVDDTGTALQGAVAWNAYYGTGSWNSMTLPRKIGGFIEGGANMMRATGMPITMGIGIMAVLVASFAATTLDTATRLQRYVISELGDALRLPPLRNRYVAVAVITGGAIAMIAGPRGPGSGGLILWPIFGATNQLLAGLSFLVIACYLMRRNKPVWFVLLPGILMILLPQWVFAIQIFGENGWAYQPGSLHLVVLGVFVSLLQAWMVVEGMIVLLKLRGNRYLSTSEGTT